MHIKKLSSVHATASQLFLPYGDDRCLVNGLSIRS